MKRIDILQFILTRRIGSVYGGQVVFSRGNALFDIMAPFLLRKCFIPILPFKKYYTAALRHILDKPLLAKPEFLSYR